MNQRELMQLFNEGMTVNTEFAVRTVFETAYELGRESVRTGKPDGPALDQSAQAAEWAWPNPKE